MKLPTVEELVKIFKDRNWTPTPTNGARIKNIIQGKCCAIPALVVYNYPDFVFEDNTEKDLYLLLNDIYGEGNIDAFWYGFDFPESGSYFKNKERIEFQILGKELREALD